MISIGLAMDAFSVSICKGLCIKNHKMKKGFIVASYFGFFQAIMPLIGFLLGSSFAHFIMHIDHWIIFILLNIFGIHMLRKKESFYDDQISFSQMISLSIATSLDSFAVGITFSFLPVSILLSVMIIGMITFFLSFIGVVIGNIIGKKGERFSTVLGGVLLILTGFRILFIHLGFI